MKFDRDRLKTFIFKQKCIPWRVSNFIESAVEEIKMKTGLIYDSKYWDREHRQLVQQTSVKPVVESIIEVFHPCSVIDIGCGDGIYLTEFLNRGVEVYGGDFSKEGLKRCRSKGITVQKLDVVKDKLLIKKKYDLVMCFEMAEHIPTHASERLVSLLSQCSDTIIFSAAQPGQGGIAHMNEQPKEFWLKILNDQNYFLNKEKTQELKNKWELADVVFYLPRNLMVLNRK